MKSIVLLSGGLDSAVMLYMCLREGWKPLCLSFRYGQRHGRELECARKLAALNSLEHLVMDLPEIFQSALTGVGNIPPSFDRSIVVPLRNYLFLTFAAAVCEQRDISDIFIGVTAEDEDFPDCRWEALDKLEEALRLGGFNLSNLKIHTPLIGMTKVEIVKVGLELGVPFHLTWSCYAGGSRPCGGCLACQKRMNAFKALKVEDPIERGGETSLL